MQVAGRLELVKQAPISRRRLRCHLKRRNALSNHLKSKLHQVAGGFFFFFCNRMRANDTPKCFSFANLQRSPTPALSCVILFMTHVGKVKRMKFLQTSPPHTVTEIQRASGASLTVSPFTLDPPWVSERAD